MASARPVTVIRELCIFITDCAGDDSMMRGGRPKSLIAALHADVDHRGQSPPKVNVVASMRDGICLGGIILGMFCGERNCLPLEIP